MRMMNNVSFTLITLPCGVTLERQHRDKSILCYPVACLITPWVDPLRSRSCSKNSSRVSRAAPFPTWPRRQGPTAIHKSTRSSECPVEEMSFKIIRDYVALLYHPFINLASDIQSPSKSYSAGNKQIPNSKQNKCCHPLADIHRINRITGIIATLQSTNADLVQ